jgi:hypothetical protein
MIAETCLQPKHEAESRSHLFITSPDFFFYFIFPPLSIFLIGSILTNVSRVIGLKVVSVAHTFTLVHTTFQSFTDLGTICRDIDDESEAVLMI